MARRYRRKIKRGYRRSYKSRGITKKGVYAIIKKQERKHTELKYFDVTGSTVNLDYNGTVVALTDIGQGVGDTQRVGDKLKLHGMKLNLHLKGNDTAKTYNNIRMIIFQWKQTTAATGVPAVGDILQGAGLFGTNQAPFAHYYWDKRDTFRVVKDKTFKIDSTLNGDNNGDKFIKKYIKLDKLHEVSYQAGTTVGEWKLYMLLLGDTGALNYYPYVNYIIRTTYTDG